MASCKLFLSLCLCLILASSAAAAAAANSGWRRELTTRSYDSLGFHENIYHSPSEDQIIIAVMDTGIWPESPSFNDDGLGPPPPKWKGICQTGNSSIPFKCNNKIIGARVYPPADLSYLPKGEEVSPRDMDGHGSHCAATIAGAPVKNISIQGVGLGTTRGAVPRARLAIYKVCWMGWCLGNTAAISDALRDGVDIISISNGINGGLQFDKNGEAYASFEASLLGVVVSYSAGNNDTLDSYTVSNSYPWAVTVANSAGSGTDYVTYVTLGDGKRLEGALMNTNDDTAKNMYPLVRVEEVSNATDPNIVGTCTTAFIKPELVEGKIIICPRLSDKPRDWNYDHLGCAGVIIDGSSYGIYDILKDLLQSRPPTRVPVTIVNADDYKYLTQYYNKSITTGQPSTATIAKTVALPDTAPRAIVGSSRGPSLSDVKILKPDISAPGVNQIDAVTGDKPGYAIKTGTSMSAPFLSGVAAYVKSLHPTWSASAIKSALMTTATPMTDNYSHVGPLAYGSGQVSPLQAADPGLVYDIGETDYIKYLCQNSNSSSEWVNTFTRRSGHDCTKLTTEQGWTLNYPSFAVPVAPNNPFVSIFKRTLTNVANTSISNYKVIVNAPTELTVNVEPSVLAFTEVGQTLSYTLTVSGKLVKSGGEKNMPNLEATIVWTDGNHRVRSPISVFEELADYNAQYLKTHGFDADFIKRYGN